MNVSAEPARTVPARDGPAGCTVRALADAGPLTKSAVRYSFTDLDEIIDLAMDAHIAAFTERVRRLPNTSPVRPPSGSSPPNAGEQAAATHSPVAVEKPRPASPSASPRR
ncbi:hypothetical protein [Nonomuraea roseoviolacea]|uniref:TetR family transcriptional regulator n=1 Tax=Nonomuraea roseoviolacea subsp. carminata TaxID=160689 RepID=A0ABT1KAI1_9ACTN|nr:hypothetical protein [Nonomuraea roseoviolacea]MCP2351032.1 hypothetical protein [Nonomuraea roseoviolacea subsp. carminata]